MSNLEWKLYHMKTEHDIYIVEFNAHTIVHTDIKEIRDLRDLTGDLRLQIAKKLQHGFNDVIGLTLCEWQKIEDKYWRLEDK